MPNTAAPASTNPGIKKRKKKANEKGYATYLHKVLKQVHPEKITISATAMELVNGLIEDLEDRMAGQSFKLAGFQKKSTLSAKHVQTATKMVFPPEMGGLAMSEGNKAVSKFFV